MINRHMTDLNVYIRVSKAHSLAVVQSESSSIQMVLLDPLARRLVDPSRRMELLDQYSPQTMRELLARSRRP